MQKKSIFTIAAALSLLLPFTLSAQTGDDFYVQKNIDYNYETMSGTLSIESYLKGEITATRKPLDIVLVLDASGSMGWEYPGKKRVLKDMDYGKYSKGWTAEDFLGYDVGGLSGDIECDYETEYLLEYKGVYYTVYISSHRKQIAFGWDNYSAYILIDGGRYYLNSPQKSEDYDKNNPLTDERLAAIIAAGPEEPRQNGKKQVLTQNNEPGDRLEGRHQTDEVLFKRKLYRLSDETISKMDKLQESVKSFIDLIYQDATTNNLDHKISIVQFASGYKKSNHLDDVHTDDFLSINRNPYKASFTQLIRDFKSVSSNQQKLKDDIDALVAKGATSADYGMTIAQELFYSNARAADKSEKVVIMFTDGEPNHHSNFDGTVANNTISKSKGLKDGTTTNSKGKVRVYSVGLFSDLNSTQMKKVNPFMNGVSSNYPSATAYTSLGTGGNHGYYQDASDLTNNDLTTVFSRIASEIKNISSLDSHTLVKDVINPAFTLPSGITTDDISIYTAPLSSISGTEYTFGKKTKISDNDKELYGISLTTGDNPSLEVSGFDYKENWCGVSGGTNRGKKLIIELPFQLKPTKALMEKTSIDTNKDGSGVYKENETTPIKKIEGSIPFKSLTIKMKGLKEGESAIIKLVKTPASGSDKEVNRIVLTGTSEETVSYTVPFLDPTATYTANQETWIWTYGKTENNNWTYGNSTKSQTKNMKDVTAGNVVMEFTNIKSDRSKYQSNKEAIKQ